MSDPTIAARPLDAATHRPPLSRWSRGAGALLVAAALSLGAIAAASPANAAAPAYFCNDNTQPYVPVSEVQGWAAGHAVTGKTVVKGTDPEGFTGSYVGRIADALGKGKDLLLFRLSNPTIDGTDGPKPAGIWAGMSGSPVYDGDGRLIGAVAYSLNAENLPIAGVTPAEYMKTIGTTAVTPAARVRMTAANLKVSTAGTRVAGASLTGGRMDQIKTVNIAGPVGAKQNSFTNRTLARTPGKAAPLLRSTSFMAAPRQTMNAAPLVAGGNVVASLTSGDLVAGSIGTVTAICGTTVWAFGHPMYFDGKTSLLLANASIALVVPDGAGLVGSYKQVSEIYAPVGMITEDRYVGIKGTIGATTGLPVTVNVRNPQGKQVESYTTTVAYPAVSAAAVAVLTGQAAMDQLDQYGAGTGKLKWTISYKRANGQAGKLTNSQVVNDPRYFPDEIGTPPADDVWALSQQNFEKVTLTGVSVTLTLLSPDAIDYELSKVQRLSGTKWVNLAGSKLKSGGSYQLRPVFQVLHNDKPESSQAGSAFTVKLPKTARTKGSVSLVSLGGAACSTDEFGDPECDDWSSVGENAKSFDDLVTLLRLQPSNDGIAGMLSYRLTKGSTHRFLNLVGPGVVSGDTNAKFTIKK
ncbi:MAG: hypothetical protein QM695_15050 [Micropruina sp.]